MEESAGMSSGPTLGLVGSNGNVQKPDSEKDKNEKAPCLVAVSSMSSEKDKESEKVKEGEAGAGESAVISDAEPEPPKRPRLTTTLLIFKKPSDDTEDYVITNTTASQEEEEEAEERHHKRRKKKKKKSKERVLSMPRSYAQKLLEMQKSMSKLTSKYQPSPYEEIDRRRRTQSASFLPISETASALKSPPLSAPVQAHTPFFPGHKGGKTSLYRRRQLSLGGTVDGKRRFTRKKRWESDDKASGFTTPTSESAKKSHLSENNVWTPMDDYRLLINISQTKGNLEHVFAGTKFSSFYTFDDVAQRWESLMYDDKAGILSQTAINNLHPVVKAKIQSEALFSDDEENLLKTVKKVLGGTPELSSFAKLLEENPNVFYHRTARKLLLHWIDMKNFHLLDSQNVRDYKDPFNLFEFQDNAYLATLPDVSVYQELRTESKLVKRQIRQLEEELESWHCMQELVLSDGTDLHSIFSISEFDDQTFAILRGKQVRYCMRSKEILLGRNSSNNKVDADLTLEGASGKVSRRQAIIQMRDFGEFFIINQGQHSIFVDSIHVPYGAMAKLSDGCVIQITHIKLIFKINDKLLRTEISNEVKKEVINARFSYKTLDTYSTPPYSPVSGLKSTGLGQDPFPMPSTSRYSSPKKKSTASASNSPVLGLSGSFTSPHVGRPSNSRSVGPVPVGLTNFVNPILPLSSSDLTIRPTSQPSSASPFLSDVGMRGFYSKSNLGGLPLVSDNDVFKKPAPVSVIRFQTGKIPGVRMSSPVTTTSGSSTSTSTSSAPSAFVPSAFVPVPGSSSAQLQLSLSNSVTVSNGKPQEESHMESPTVRTNPDGGSIVLPLPPIGQLMDSTKLGLSSDVTVTQRTPQPMEVSQSPTYSTPENSGSQPQPQANIVTQSGGCIEEQKESRPPSLGLVTFESS